MRLILLLFFIAIGLSIKAQTITDYDGNVYPVVIIGNQKWMAMNLRATHFQDGSPVVNAGYNNWYFFPLDTPRYCEPVIPPNTTDTLALGYWYNYPAAGDPRNICPKGWHAATDADWYNMIHFLDPNSDTMTTLESTIAGGALKDTVMWVSPNAGATNSTGFSVLPVSDISGSILPPAGFVCCQGLNASFWCGGPPWMPGTICYDRYLEYMQPVVIRNTDNYSNGKSIRCVCDTLEITSVNENQFGPDIFIYPIPSSGKVTISTSGSPLGKILIHDAVGRLQYDGFSKEIETVIDITGYAKGIYFISLPALERRVRIIKE